MKTPAQLGLPAKFENWRPGQGELVEKIATSQENIFLLGSPPGTGKSVVAVAAYRARLHSRAAIEVMNRLTGEHQKPERCIYITPTKQLQTQLVDDFPFAKSIKGRSNYPCPKNPKLTADECTNSENKPCPHRHGFRTNPTLVNPDGLPAELCPYYTAKAAAVNAPLAVMNTTYYLSEIAGPGQFSGADLLIIDEVDGMEKALMSFVQLEITSRQLDLYKIKFPEQPHTLAGWMFWANQLDLTNHIKQSQLGFSSVPESQWTDIEIKQFKSSKKLENFFAKIKWFNVDVNSDWIFDEKIDDKGSYIWTFKPTRVNTYAEKYLWSHSKQALGMSGTILDPALTADDLGIKTWDYAQAECPFPLINRPIYYTPVVNLTNKTMNEQLPILAQAVTDLLEQYPNEKVLVHTTSYPIRNYLFPRLPASRVISHESEDRTEKLEKFKNSREPLVMLSPSMDRGVDLPEDLCRCIIICKVPYISMGDKQVQARMKMPGGQRWYLLQAVRTIIQMSGRGVRGDLDKCDTFILDRQFGRLLAQMGSYFSKWWTDALVRK